MIYTYGLIYAIAYLPVINEIISCVHFLKNKAQVI